MTREELDARIAEIAASDADESERLDRACALVDETGETLTLSQIAAVLRVSRERVRVIIAQALDAARRETLGLSRRGLRETLADRDFMDSIRCVGREADTDGEILRAIRSFDGAGPSAAIAERLGLHESTIHESCDRLRRKGLVEYVAGPWGGWVAA